MLGSELGVVRGDGQMSLEARRDATSNFMSMVRCALASKRVTCEHGLTESGWDWLVGRVREEFDASLVQPGEMVGCLAAQSIGEPTTQMCLNSGFLT